MFRVSNFKKSLWFELERIRVEAFVVMQAVQQHEHVSARRDQIVTYLTLKIKKEVLKFK